MPYRGLSSAIDDWSAARKLTFPVVTLALCLAGAGVVASSLMWNASTALAESGNEYLPLVQLATTFETEMLNARTDVVYRMTGQQAETLESGAEHLRRANEAAAMLRAQIAASPRLSGFLTPADQMSADLTAYQTLLARILEAVKNGQTEDALFADLVKDWTRADHRLTDTAAEFRRQAGELARRAALQDASTLDHGARTTAAVCLLAGLLGAALGVFLGRDMKQALGVVSRDLQASAQQFAGVSGEVAATADSLLHTANGQKAGLRELSASCARIEAASQAGQSSAQSLACKAGELEQASEAGLSAAGRVTNSLGEIAASNGNVSSIVSVIDRLAMQTGILAASAGAEAARSAEAARTLAELASEVGELAQRSALSARETAEAVERTAEAVKAGIDHAEAVAGSLSGVTSGAIRTREMADALYSEASAQARSIGGMMQVVSEVEIAAGAVTTGAAATASTSTGLRERAAGIHEIVFELALLAEGRRRGNVAVRPVGAIGEQVPETTAA